MMPPLTVPQGLLVTPIVKPTIKKRKNNELVSVQKPSNVKSGRNKKIKEAPLASLECGVENLSISKTPQKPIEALAIEDRPASYKLFGKQLFSS
jgi:hypothetical protein